jgi:hypothetical protein
MPSRTPSNASKRSEKTLLARGPRKGFQVSPRPSVLRNESWLQEILEENTEKSALLLRELLGEIRLEPLAVEDGKPFIAQRPQ